MLCNLMGNEKCSQCGLTFEWIHLNGYRQCSDCCRKALDRQRELVAAEAAWGPDPGTDDEAFAALLADLGFERVEDLPPAARP